MYIRTTRCIFQPSVGDPSRTGELVAVRKHREGEARNLGDDVINARLEAGGHVVECAGRAVAATALSSGR